MDCSSSDIEAQLGSPTLSQASTVANVESQPQHNFTTKWAVVLQALDESCTLIQVALQNTDNSEQIWKRIREDVCSSSLSKRLEAWMSIFFAKTVVGTGTMSQTQIWDSTLSNKHQRFSLHNYIQDWVLTEALHNPKVFLNAPDYLANNDHFAIKQSTTGSKLNGQKVIVIRKILDKTKVAWLLIFLLIISPGLGIVVGCYTHKAEVGIAVSAGIFALASFLQGLAAWFHE